jgi:predicted component of type VI protein secretion system
MRFRLRYLQKDIPLLPGEFAIGRNASCELSLDDPLVSRRHALLIVNQHSVEVEDLGSRNGVIVNGEKIEGRYALRPGDVVLIGGQEITLLTAREHTTTLSANDPARLTLPKIAPAVKFGENLSTTSTVSAHGIPASIEPDSEPSMVRRADAFKLLGGVAEKALAMGRAAEAERLLASPLADVIEACRMGRLVPAALADQAARFSAKLATSTGKGGWADYVIELYMAQGRPPPAPVIDELYNAMRKVTAIDLTRLRAYIEKLRGQAGGFGPAERFLLQRLEGLERLAALR